VKVGKGHAIRPNAGSESVRHLVGKSLVGYDGLLNGYQVDSEVEITKNGETQGQADCLLWGHPTRTTLCVEVETSPEADTLETKKAKYVDGTAIQDILMLNISDMPVDMIEAAEWVATELGLEL